MADDKKVPKRQNNIPSAQSIEDVEISLEKNQMKSPFTPLYRRSYCQTQFDSDVFEYIWKLDRWSRLSKAVEVLTSGQFSEKDRSSIRMEIFPAPDWCESKVKFFINIEEPFKGSCDVYTIQADNKVLHNSVWGHMPDMTLLFETTTKLLFEHSDEDTVIIGFTFEIFHRILTNSLHLQPLPSPLVRLTDVKSINLDNSEIYNTDSVTFVINDEQYNISKKLLDEKSNHLTNFYKIYAKTNKGDIIFIKNNDIQEAFKIMLSYIRTGLIPALIDYYTLTKLLRVASQCNVTDLKLLCEQYLIQVITMYTAIELIQLAVMFDAKCLKEHVINFIQFHIREILLTNEFQLLSQIEAYNIIKLIGKNKLSGESKFTICTLL